MKGPHFDCPKHGPQPCLVACVHIIATIEKRGNTLRGYLQKPTNTRNGQAYCFDCLRSVAAIAPEKLAVVCWACFREREQKDSIEQPHNSPCTGSPN